MYAVVIFENFQDERRVWDQLASPFKSLATFEFTLGGPSVADEGAAFLQSYFSPNSMASLHLIHILGMLGID